MAAFSLICAHRISIMANLLPDALEPLMMLGYEDAMPSSNG